MAEGVTVPDSINEKLDNVLRLSERMLIKLFGEVEGETPTGRLPKLEATQTAHENRIRALERSALRIGGAMALLGVLVGILEAAAHVATAVRH